MVKVLIVDDSAFMRNALTSMLSSDPEIMVVGTARDGVEAVQKAAELGPDLITLDVEMPRMDGLESLRIIMEKHPVPVLMVSSLTTEGAQATLDALDLGAVDFIPKNLSELSINIVKIKQVLIEKVKQIAKKGLVAGRRAPGAPRDGGAILPLPARTTGERRIGVVAIGTSTGGPMALREIILRLPENFPVPIVIAQHMPPAFTAPFAARLNQLSRVTVKEAAAGEPLRPGVAFIAPGGGHMSIRRTRGVEVVVGIDDGMGEFIYRPSVDRLMLSVAECYPGRALAVILSGMGSDGLKGAAAVRESGGRVFVQNEETCVVYGMPRAAVEAGIADKVLPVEEMAGEIINAV